MDKRIFAFVGMPGAGKSEAAAYLQDKSVPFIRFGQFTDEEIKKRGMELTPDNERLVREDLRVKYGMAAYAVLAQSKIEELLHQHDVIALDGLYSWEEYRLLKDKFSTLTLILIYAEPLKRYERLKNRPIRPVPQGKSRERDILEIEKLNKGGPIAIADYCIINNGEMDEMYREIDIILERLNIKL